MAGKGREKIYQKFPTPSSLCNKELTKTIRIVKLTT